MQYEYSVEDVLKRSLSKIEFDMQNREHFLKSLDDPNLIKFYTRDLEDMQRQKTIALSCLKHIKELKELAFKDLFE